MDMVPAYVGLDYHDETIRVCVMDADGEVLCNRNVPNDPGAVRDLVRRLGGLARGVAIEACCGAADFATQLAALTEWSVACGAAAARKAPTNRSRDASIWPTSRVVSAEVWLADEFAAAAAGPLSARVGPERADQLRIRASAQEPNRPRGKNA
jgi:hypothetical protein